jgi:transposase
MNGTKGNRKAHPGRYPAEIREEAVRLFKEALPEHGTRTATAAHVSGLLGIGTAETVRGWVRQAEVDAGESAGATTEQLAEMRRLKRENAELKRVNGILKAASAFFAAELDRPQGK